MDIAVSAVSLADICIRYGNILVKACKSYKHADMEIRESILLIETLWLKIQRQLELLRDIWPSLDEDYQIHQNGVLQVLQGKAQAAITLIDSLIGSPSDEGSTMKSMLSKKGEARRLKYAVWVKTSLKSVLVDLKDWAEVFDVSWYLIIRLSSKEIDQQLSPLATNTNEMEPLSTLKTLRDVISVNLSGGSKDEKTSLFLPEKLFEENSIKLENSEAEIWNEVEVGEQYLIDQPNNISTLSDICKLAKVLQKVDPFKFGILTCRGLFRASSEIWTRTPNRFVFSIPKDLTEPQCLRTFIRSENQDHPLDERFEVAKQLAKAAMFVHSADFVHKNIRPETILLFRSRQTGSLYAFLIGFESFRLAEGKTQYHGDDLWERNLYRHPTRQSIQPEEDYTMQHDIYSLGVCLLEIGLGDSLVVQQTGDQHPKPNESLLNVPPIKDRRKKAFETKRKLVKIAQTQLSPKMGRRYAETVVTCLTCLDKNDNSFGDQSEFLDENGVLVGVRFIEKILTTLLDLKI